MIITYIIIYIICYVLCFTVLYYNKVANYESFEATLKELIPMYFLSFTWPILLFYVVTAQLLKWIATGLSVIYVYVKSFINTIKSKKKKNGGKK